MKILILWPIFMWATAFSFEIYADSCEQDNPTNSFDMTFQTAFSGLASCVGEKGMESISLDSYPLEYTRVVLSFVSSSDKKRPVFLKTTQGQISMKHLGSSGQGQIGGTTWHFHQYEVNLNKQTSEESLSIVISLNKQIFLDNISVELRETTNNSEFIRFLDENIFTVSLSSSDLAGNSTFTRNIKLKGRLRSGSKATYVSQPFGATDFLSMSCSNLTALSYSSNQGSISSLQVSCSNSNGFFYISNTSQDDLFNFEIDLQLQFSVSISDDLTSSDFSESFLLVPEITSI